MERHKPVDWDSDVSDSAYVDGGVPRANLIDDETHYAQTIAGAMIRAGITAGVILWDTLASETLSHAVDRYLEHPVGRVLAIGAIAITSGHLLNLFEKYNIPDPIQETANFVSGSIRKAIRGEYGRRADRNSHTS